MLTIGCKNSFERKAGKKLREHPNKKKMMFGLTPRLVVLLVLSAATAVVTAAPHRINEFVVSVAASSLLMIFGALRKGIFFTQVMFFFHPYCLCCSPRTL